MARTTQHDRRHWDCTLAGCTDPASTALLDEHDGLILVVCAEHARLSTVLAGDRFTVRELRRGPQRRRGRPA